MRKMVRSFEVRANRKYQVSNLSRELDQNLLDLQNKGWEIMNVVSIPCQEYDYESGHFDSVLFTIIAKYEEK